MTKPYIPAILSLGLILLASATFGYIKMKDAGTIADNNISPTTTDSYDLVDETPVEVEVVVEKPVTTPEPVVPTPIPTPKPPVGTPEKPVVSGYTLADVSAHNSKTSCWTAIEGRVYDITKYINQHPGGSAVLRGCGVDGTRIFNNVGAHRGTIAGLDQYVIGPLI